MLNFSKMHGLGNDFMVIDATQTPFSLNHQTIAALGNRHTGIGFDQLLVIEPATHPEADFNYRIFNTDGSEVEHCGNGARCFGKFIVDKQLSDKKALTVQVKKGLIRIEYQDDDHIRVDMGKPIVLPAQVPFQTTAEFSPELQYTLDLPVGKVTVSVLSMGNPHVVLFVDNLMSLDIADFAKIIQQSDYFPESVNVNFVEHIDSQTLLLRTYERGVGETDACGTGACASAVAAAALKIVNPQVTIKTRGGDLLIDLKTDGSLTMTGPARHVYDATLDPSLLK